MTATVAGIHLGPDTHANRPAGNAVPDGSLYSCSDHDLIYKSNYAGNSWSTYADFSGGVTPNTLSVTHVYRATDQNVAGSGTLTEISFSNEVTDDAGCWVVGTPTRITIPAGLNGRKGRVYMQIYWSGSASGNYRQAGILKNGGGIAHAAVSDISTSINVAQQAESPIQTFATNDYYEAYMQADATGIGAVGGDVLTFFGMYTVD